MHLPNAKPHTSRTSLWGGYDGPHFVKEEMVAKTQTLRTYEEGRKKEEKEWVCWEDLVLSSGLKGEHSFNLIFGALFDSCPKE